MPMPGYVGCSCNLNIRKGWLHEYAHEYAS